MAHKFIGRKEVAFVNSINKELIQRVVGQEIFYYAILAEKTKKNSLYNEAVSKVWAPPVRCNALVTYENSQEQIGMLPPDSKYSLDIYFHKLEIEERNVMPKMGDFVLFDNIMFEIHQVTESQLMWGMINNKVMTKCNCKPARKGQFDPPKQPTRQNHYDLNAPKYSEQPSQRPTTGDPRAKGSADLYAATGAVNTPVVSPTFPFIFPLTLK